MKLQNCLYRIKQKILYTAGRILFSGFGCLHSHSFVSTIENQLVLPADASTPKKIE
jgi:hypothetical protein